MSRLLPGHTYDQTAVRILDQYSCDECRHKFFCLLRPEQEAEFTYSPVAQQ